MGGILNARKLQESTQLDIPFPSQSIRNFREACSKFFNLEDADNQSLMELDLRQLTDALVIANYFTADRLYETLLNYTALKLLHSDTLIWNVPELRLPVAGSSDLDLTPYA